MDSHELTCNQCVKYLAIILDKNSTYVFHVQRVLSKLANYICFQLSEAFLQFFGIDKIIQHIHETLLSNTDS